MTAKILCLLFIAAQVSVVTNRYDHYTTGANTSETILSSSNVNVAAFGKLYSYYVDGAVYAQPLYFSALPIPEHGTHNVLYIATMNDKVYAFDAECSGPPLWMRDFTDEMGGVTPVPISDITNRNDLNIVGNAGIESTPVIDAPLNSLYLVARTKESGRYVQRLRRLDIRTGSDIVPPATIEARVTGSAADAVDGEVHFDAKAGNQRVALALANGTVVIAWASHEDLKPYHGWIMAYDASTLKQTGALCLTPDTGEGGVWQSGRPPAIDSRGDLYFEVGNGGWDGQRNFGSSVLKLHLLEGSLMIVDYFTPHDYEYENLHDEDLGSTGPLFVPGTHVLVCGNKKGELFLLDAGRLGHMTPGDSGIRQIVETNGGRVLAGPAYWNGPAGPVLFLWNEADVAKVFHFQGDRLLAVAYAKGTIASHGSPGGALTVSSDGNKPGSGILWATISTRSADHGNAPGVLYAFDAENLHEIWNSEERPKRDRLGTLVKFVPPLVASGKVYIPTYDNALNVYGLLPKAKTTQ
jgi:hypothetical protein